MKDTGGPAFPQNYVDRGGGITTGEPYGEGGLTMRDYFAGQALAGLIEDIAKDHGVSWEDGARACYRMADAMLAVRNE